MTDFSQLARSGRNGPARWTVGLVLIGVCWLLLGGVVSVLLLVVLGADPADPASAGPLPAYIALNLPFVLLLAGLWLVVRGIHHRGLRSLVTPAARIDRRRLLEGFLGWTVLLAILAGVRALFDADGLALVFDPVRFLQFLPIVLVLTTLQATVEELLFRGHLLQGIGLLTRRRWVLVVATAVLFTLPHLGNTEVDSGFLPATLYYFAFGVVAATVTVWDNRSELAIGIHVATSLFGTLVVAFEESSLQTPAIFSSGSLEPWRELLEFAVMGAVFCAWTLRSARRHAPRTEPAQRLIGSNQG